MENAMMLFGFLLLTMMGLLLPLLTVLFSLLPKGMEMLATKYEGERSQSEQNIAEEIKKRDSASELDYKALTRTLRTLERLKKEAKTKLSFLSPQKIVTRTYVPLTISFVAILIALLNAPAPQTFPTFVFMAATTISVIAFLLTAIVLWFVFQVLSEVAKAVNESGESNESKIIELLSALVEESGTGSLFLKPQNIEVRFNKEILEGEKIFAFSVNKKYEIPILFVNRDELMAKQVELGFVFPTDFLIEKTPNVSSIFRDKDVPEQVVRFLSHFIQANTTQVYGDMSITFLKIGEFKVRAFVKGENIRNKGIRFSIKVID